MFKKALYYIAGSEQKLSLEHRLFNFFCFMFLLISLTVPVTLFEIFYNPKWLALTAAYSLNNLACYLVGRLSKTPVVKDYYLISTTLLTILFFLFGSRYTPGFAGLISISFFTIILSKSKNLVWLIIYFIVLFPFVFFLKKYLIQYPVSIDNLQSTGNIIYLAIICIGLVIVLLYYKHYFEREKQKTKRQHLYINEKNRQLEEQKMEIEKISQKKVDFFTYLAHEMRTPITLINNYVLQYFEKEKNDERYHIIVNNIEKLLNDVEFYLNAEKLQRRLKIFNHNQIISFSMLLCNKVSLFAENARLKNIVIEDDIEADLHIKADPIAIDTLINNLIDNALKFSVLNNKIIVKLHRHGNQLVLIVKDFGVGIPIHEQKKIFDKFFQGNINAAHNKGLGIGLSIVSDIIKELKGTIDIKSEEQKGTEFRITFTRHVLGERDDIVEYKASQLRQEQTIKSTITDSKFIENRHNLLIVEDNHEMLGYLKEELSKQHNIYVAKSGNEAIQKLKNFNTPHVIITDVMMNDMDGFSFIEAIMADERFMHIPVIFLTAKTTNADMLKGLKLGAVDYISKPFSINELRLKIDSILKISNLQKQDILQKTYESMMGELGVRMETSNNKELTNSLFNQFQELNLTKREIEITNYIIEGLSNKEIGGKLNISAWTVAKHIQNIFDKADTHSRTELIQKLRA